MSRVFIQIKQHAGNYYIRTDSFGFDWLNRVEEQLANIDKKDLKLDFSNVTWFDANLCAPLAAILRRHVEGKVKIEVGSIKVKAILQKNGFLQDKISDDWGSTIQYKRFFANEFDSFLEYINLQFAKRVWPNTPDKVRKGFRVCLGELFSNASDHAKIGKDIFTCGQFYPRKHILEFTIADNGVGIRSNVVEFLGRDISALEAVEWAMSGMNTTRKGDIPGGLGLKILKEFVIAQDGRLTIVSGEAYCEVSHSGQILVKLSRPFPGTAVSIKLKTDGKNCILTAPVEHDDFAF